MSDKQEKEDGLILKDDLDQTYCIPWSALEQFKVSQEDLTENQLDAISGGVKASAKGRDKGLTDLRRKKNFKIAMFGGCTDRPCIN